MSESLSVVQWFFIIFATSQTLPIGVSYREVQAVSFHDWKQSIWYYPSKYNKKIGRGTRFLRRLFLSGAWSTYMFTLLFLGWFMYIFYQQDSEIRDTVMSLTLVFFAMMVLVPYVFVMTDRYVITEYQQEIRKNVVSSPNSNDWENEDTREFYKKKYYSATAFLKFYCFMLIVGALVVLFISTFTIKDQSRWESIVMIVAYALMTVGSFVPLFFVCHFPALHKYITPSPTPEYYISNTNELK
jgi:hypothetical protein